jgi:hypothetical protein
MRLADLPLEDIGSGSGAVSGESQSYRYSESTVIVVIVIASIGWSIIFSALFHRWWRSRLKASYTVSNDRFEAEEPSPYVDVHFDALRYRSPLDVRQHYLVAESDL